GLENTAVLSAVTALLSNLVSNVPAVLVIKPFIGEAGDPQRGWLVVAMASTLAGNLTVLGSVANLIVLQLARAHGITIGFRQPFRRARRGARCAGGRHPARRRPPRRRPSGGRCHLAALCRDRPHDTLARHRRLCRPGGRA